MHFSPEFLFIVFIVMYIAEVYGSMIGGGSFLIQSVLIALGVPPHIAVAHDVAGANGTNIGGALVFYKYKQIRYELVLWWIPGLIIGALLGVKLLVSVEPWVIEKSLGFFALFGLIYMLFLKKEQGVKEQVLPRKWHYLSIPFSFIVGVYFGFSSAGTGILTSFLLVSFFGLTFIQSLAARKVIHFIPMLVAALSYMYLDLLYLDLWLVMFSAGFLAGLTGSFLSLKIGNERLKWIFMSVVAILALWLLFK